MIRGPPLPCASRAVGSCPSPPISPALNLACAVRSGYEYLQSANRDQDAQDSAPKAQYFFKETKRKPPRAICSDSRNAVRVAVRGICNGKALDKSIKETIEANKE